MNLRIVYTPQPIDHQGADAAKAANLMLDRLISGLTFPLTGIEKSPRPKEREKLSRIPFKGTLDEVQQFFQNRGWTDGLPVIPPTEESVKKMLAGTSHPASEVLGLMAPESWEVTVEGVAINGVMAGCKPKHMPVLLATIEAFRSQPMFYSFVRSAGSYGFLQLVNGPIVEEIGMNYRHNTLGPGSPVNWPIGRAFRLCIINQGGSVPAVNLMASQGNVFARGVAIAENEKASPWEPYHVSRGFKAGESVLTMFGGEGGFSNPMRDEIVKRLKIDKHRMGSVVIIDPLLARLYVEQQGFAKKSDLQKWFWDSAKVTIAEWRDSYFYVADVVPTLGKPGCHPAWYADPKLSPDTMVNVFPNPEAINLVVAGGGAGPVCEIIEMMLPCSVSIDKWR
jgi:hypothetical protein